MTRLTNRVAVQTFLTAFAFVVGLIALPGALGGYGLPGRLLSALPMVAALGLAAWGRRGRAELRRARDRLAPPRAGGASPARP